MIKNLIIFIYLCICSIKVLSLFHAYDTTFMKMLIFLHISVKLPLRWQAAACSLIPIPFQRKVNSTLQPAIATCSSPFIDIIPDPTR